MASPLGHRLRAVREDGRGPVLAAVSGAWFLSLGTRLTYPALLPHLREAFGFGLATAGALVTTLWVMYALGQLPGGILSDRYGSGRILLASTVATGAAVVLVVLSTSVAWLFAATGVLALCTAVTGPARLPLLSAVFPDRGGSAIGVTQAAGNLGNTLLPLAGGVLASLTAWQLGLGFVVPIFAVVAVALWRVVPRSPVDRGGADGTGVRETVRSLAADFTSRSVVVIVAVQVLGSATYQAFTGFYPTYLIEVKAVSPGVAAGLFGVFFATGTLVQPFSGAAGDRFGERRGLVLVLAVAGAALVALPFAAGLPALVTITVGLGIMLGRSTLALTYLTASLSRDIRGTGLGAVRTGYQLLGASAPLAVGVLAEVGLFDEAFFGLAAVFGLMIAVVTVLPPEPG